MIISRAPVRITLGGGGTDLPSFYEAYGGFLISGAINKYCFVTANRQFYDTYRLKGYVTDESKTLEDIKHNLFREALKLYNIDKGIELSSISDIPSRTGLGSSGAFLVALLNTLAAFKTGKSPSKRQLAEDACKIELEILKEHEGKQDKYSSAFAGIKAYEFHRNGSVSVLPLRNTDIIASELEQKLTIWFTGITRHGTASDTLKIQDEKTKRNDADILKGIHRIKEIGYETKEALEDHQFDMFGRLLDDHWEIKKKMASKKPSDKINNTYEYAKKHGALGGKVMGASADAGFFMFYHPGETKDKWEFESKMEKYGLHQLEFKFDDSGVITLFNGGEK